LATSSSSSICRRLAQQEGEPPGSFQFGHLHFDWVLRIAAEGDDACSATGLQANR
jgi:hypothetical protein